MITSTQAAQQLGVSRRRVLQLLAEGRIKGAAKAGRDWLIPSPVQIESAPRGQAAHKRKPVSP